MGVFTFVCRSSGHEWNAKQISDGDIEASGSSTFELQRKLVQSALSADSSGAVQSSFAYVTPSSAVFQVIIGGSSGGAFFGGGGGGAVATPAGGAGAAAEAPAAEEKKKEEEPESDDDMGFSLFD
ncbi:60S ACIDIC RIBOSOMAL PROTEIN P3-1-RELATED [Salix purpurea]|uniref:60S ACIDIC RIBOSOMAL PROTEIN P3-1-RELATED n=2 Tax=Salix TaxID=40685 RepID=A0A9Q0QHE0_SALPP|nr:60S ACIDIC RIBOSOMAL PROTEIN P3-1-RELATED [Salix koriyanagi]KAJ6706709.1 60S ACIDIC RIBOSOMAL PROTEIN P3-1-RELATED [Salix purpurea]KAJ6706720.1 60S ACIDIC RIBOSOMAL PROTEIN P3-1-RELATED [Salix purpurea]